MRLYLTYFWCYIFHNFSLLITLCIELHCNLIILRHCFSRSLLIDLLPRIHVMIDFSIEKEIFLRIQDTSLNMVHLVFQLLFRRSESNIACPILTLIEKTNGVKFSFSTLKNTLVTFSLFLHFICSVTLS